jgi:hypothetical protein
VDFVRGLNAALFIRLEQLRVNYAKRAQWKKHITPKELIREIKSVFREVKSPIHWFG